MATLLLEPPHAESATSGSTATVLHNRRVRAVLWLTLIFWLSQLVTVTLAAALASNPRVVEIFFMRLAMTILGLFFCFLIHLILRTEFLSTTRKRLIALAITTPIFAETFAWGTFFAVSAVDPTVTIKSFTWSGAVSTIALNTWFFLAWAGLYLAISYSFDVQEEQQRAAEIRELAHAAQLRSLHSQINPHFLFNSLNSVSALILDGKMGKAEEMVVKLADFLREGLAGQAERQDPARVRIEFPAGISRTRAGSGMRDLATDIDVPDQLRSALVPALILQPIVENAVKYGVAGSPPPTRISITAWTEERRLFLQVTDSGRGGNPKAPGAGIGLSNVIERIRLIYGATSAELTAGRLADGRFQAQLTLPLEFA